MPFTRLPEAASSPDPLLMPYVQAFEANDEKRARACLDTLIHEYADPIIAAAVHRYVARSFGHSSHDPADVRGETVLRLMLRLTPGHADAQRVCSIGDFRAYVKLTARHVCWNHASKVRPEMGACSFDLDMDDMVTSRTDVHHQVSSREHLRDVWKEIQRLPLMQRRALLCNFRGPDGGDGLRALSAAIGLTTGDLVAVLQIPYSEVTSLLTLLPMENSAIGDWLNLSTLEVNNLRMAARRRLQRRLRDWGLDT